LKLEVLGSSGCDICIFAYELNFELRLSSSHLLADRLSYTLGDRTSSDCGFGTLLITTSCLGFLDCSFGLEGYFGGWEEKLDYYDSKIIGPFVGIFTPTDEALGLFSLSTLLISIVGSVFFDFLSYFLVIRVNYY
jgi:hypothetical protein